VARIVDTLSQAVVALPPGVSESGMVLSGSESKESQKTKNSGNEAKKWLKTKGVTFLSAVICARFACKSALITP
jgi:hypothetical protein